LQLVEEGKAYVVDWARLVWAVLKAEVVVGTTQQYTPFLLRMLEYQRPEFFADVDERLPHRCHKRWKDRAFQTDGRFGISKEYELEEEEEEIPLDYGLCQDI
jgi:hypothetical protein